VRTLGRARGRLGASVALAAVLGALGACEDGPTEVVFQVIETATFHDSLYIDLADFTELSSGVYIRDDSIGTGPVIAAGDSVSLNHTGWLTTGGQLSTGPFSIEYLTTNLIEGFTLGIEGMAEGGTRFFIVPPELGYGSNPPFGSPIPQGAILIFEVDILDVY
jgi:hypothetical protein